MSHHGSSHPGDVQPTAPAKPTDPVQTGWGAPVPDNRNSLTVGPHGPMLMDVHYFDKISHFDRERIPERVVHARGAGAFGYFEVTHDITAYSKASIFAKVGKKTRSLVRFSHVTGERGAVDLERDPRGFACKFYTEDGNWDLVCNNVPVFFVRDPMLFPDLIHSQKPNPVTNLKDASAFWDFLSSAPESVHLLTMLYSDRGVPYSWRHMDGFGNHTFSLINKNGERTWVKFHLKADAGIKSFTSEAAKATRGADSDFHVRDLYDFLLAGGSASWTMFVQLIPEADVPSLPYNIFDVTKVVPHGDYPLQQVGKLVLNEMPTNFFADIEQAAFCPGNLVPGIDMSPDRTLQGRLISYSDTQRHRLGPNFLQLHVNRPRCPVHNHQRDGLMAIFNPDGQAPYHTGLTATGGPQALAISSLAEFPADTHGKVGRYDQAPADPDDDFKQPRELWSRVLTEDERERLVSNIAGHLGLAHMPIQKRMVDIFSRVHPDYGSRVQDKLMKLAAGVIHPTAAKVPSAQPPALAESESSSNASIVDLTMIATASGIGNVVTRDADSRHGDSAAASSSSSASSTGSSSTASGTMLGPRPAFGADAAKTPGVVGKIVSAVRSMATGSATQ